MAEQQNMGAGFPNLTNLNPEGMGDEYNTNLNAIKSTLDDLEARYQKPNWFKIAAGFAKPQLGGFTASLGSAAEAMGENVEQQRRMAIPIAQMRAQLGVQQAVMGQNKQAADYLDNWQKEHPGQQVPQDVYEHAASISPNTPRVQAVGKSLEVARAQQGQNLQAQQQALTILHDQYATGAIDKQTYQAQLAALKANSPYEQKTSQQNQGQPGMQPSAPTVTGNIQPTDIGAVESHNTPGAVGPNVPGQGTAKSEMQVMDATAANPGYGVKPAQLNGNPDHDESERTRVGKDYFSALKKEFGNDTLAAAAYNWGPGNVKNWQQAGANPDKMPQSVRDYVAKAHLNGAMHGAPTIEQKPDQAPVSFESAGASGPQSTELAKGQLDKLNDMWAPKVQKIISNDPEVTEKRASDFYRAGSLTQDPAVQNAVGQLYKDKGFLAALQSSIAKGLDIGVSTPGGGFNASVSAPVETYLTALNADPQTRQKLLELNRIIINDAISDMRENTQALGGGHTSSSEFSSLMGRMATTSDPYKLINQYMATRAVENDKNARLYDAWTKYSSKPNFATLPHSNFFNSNDYKGIVKEYGKKYRQAQTVAD